MLEANLSDMRAHLSAAAISCWLGGRLLPVSELALGLSRGHLELYRRRPRILLLHFPPLLLPKVTARGHVLLRLVGVLGCLLEEVLWLELQPVDRRAHAARGERPMPRPSEPDIMGPTVQGIGPKGLHSSSVGRQALKIRVEVRRRMLLDKGSLAILQVGALAIFCRQILVRDG